jgi:hypothetical protein
VRRQAQPGGHQGPQRHRRGRPGAADGGRQAEAEWACLTTTWGAAEAESDGPTMTWVAQDDPRRQEVRLREVRQLQRAPQQVLQPARQRVPRALAPLPVLAQALVRAAPPGRRWLEAPAVRALARRPLGGPDGRHHWRSPRVAAPTAAPAGRVRPRRERAGPAPQRSPRVAPPHCRRPRLRASPLQPRPVYSPLSWRGPSSLPSWPALVPLVGSRGSSLHVLPCGGHDRPAHPQRSRNGS